MSIPFMAFHLTKKYVGTKEGLIALPVFWITFEYFHHNWEGPWVWLTLGNAFANYPPLVQWYEYTGRLGGSLWVIIINILIFRLVTTLVIRREKPGNIIPAMLPLDLVLMIPVLFSVFRYLSRHEDYSPVHITAVQPNIDPYKKFDEISPREQLNQLLQLATEGIDSTTRLLVAPETALTEDIWENDLSRSNSIKELTEFLKKYPNLKIVIGASTYRLFEPNEQLSESARKFRDADEYYDAYNTAFFLDTTGRILIHHKSKLVVGSEKLLFSWLFKPLENFALDLGGTSGTLGVQQTRNPFLSSDGKISVVPSVCYESVFGEYTGEYLRNGGGIIAVITNDGWWGNTPGYKQHFAFARILAIEHRRSIVQSANTGISGFINQRGDVISRSEWWQPVALKETLNENQKLTPYTRYGDFLGRISSFISLLLFGWTVVNRIKRK